MAWSKPGLQIFGVDTQGEVIQQKASADVKKFILSGSGFNKDESHFIFVHASSDSSLQQQQIIPCVNEGDVEVMEDSETLSVNVSLNECREGNYHLVGWSPIEDQNACINNTTVYENAFELKSA